PPSRSLRDVIIRTTWRDRALSAASHAGLLNNLNDGVAMATLGLGTALVYPTLLAVVSDVADPQWRATATGAYRFWRDAGYVIGALVAGVVADRLGLNWAVGVVAALTLASGLVTLG